MNWETLYTEKKLGSRNLQWDQDTSRGVFLRDYDKVIFSSQFRKLQNKTQVFPMPSSLFVHNRLTHSLEVASVGRTMGRSIGEFIIANFDLNAHSQSFYNFNLSDVIQTACLAHDIGNPPFGHFGEEAIRDFFIELFKKDSFDLTDIQKRDLCFFEGNANAFRILSTLFQNQGLKLTYTTLASIVKYPTNSLYGFNKNTGTINSKKSGFFDSEKVFFEQTISCLNIPNYQNGYCRHPFVFLVEAADDICYRIIDLEDSVNLNIIDFQEAYQLLIPFFGEDEKGDFVKKEILRTERNSQKIALLRAMLIDKLSNLSVDVFKNNYESILDGNQHQSLMDLLPTHYKDLIKVIDKISVQKIYNSKSVIEKELAGYNTIQNLLKIFVKAILSPSQAKSQKILTLMDPYLSIEMDSYKNFLSVTDYITDLTDEQSTHLLKTIEG